MKKLGYITGTGSDVGVHLGAFIEVILALAGVGTALALYPIVKRQNQPLALGFVTSRLLEASMIIVGVVSLLTVVTLKHDSAGATGADAAALVTTGKSLVAFHNWTFVLGQSLMPGVNALLLGIAALPIAPGAPHHSAGRAHRRPHAARVGRGDDLRPLGPDLARRRDRRLPGRSVGVLARRLAGRQGLHPVRHHLGYGQPMIEARGLVKKYGDTVAVGGLTFDVQPGLVTGFLGPNGSGKSTTLRMVLGLDAPTEGTVTVNGRPYNQHRHPLREVGALLEAHAIHPGRSAYNHLLGLAQSNGLERSRVDAVLEQVGLTEAAKTRVGNFSLGMGQRLGIAAALLGDPEVLLFDEPVNGLDPEGILWIRTLMRSLAEQGPDGVRLEPPDERDGPDRRPADRDRARGAHRRHHRAGLHQRKFAEPCPGPLTAR